MSNTSQSEVDVKSSSHVWFTTEIQHMMHGFGDCSRPLVESAMLLESIVLRQMTQVLYQVEDICRQRNARCLGIEDFLFLMRRDKCKMRRLLRFLEFRGLKAVAVKGSGLDEDDVNDLDAKSHLRKRQKICQEFINVIDQTGELATIMDDLVEDEVKKQRNMRLELMTRQMDTQQYLEFCEARQASFSPRYKVHKFRDWLMTGSSVDIKPNQFALEILSYLAYETVAEIVDLALVVKRDMKVKSEDILSHEMAPVCANYDQFVTTNSDQSAPATSNASNLMSPPAPKTPNTLSGTVLTTNSSVQSNGVLSKTKKAKKSDASHDLLSDQAITATEIREAFRRLSQPIGPFADFKKISPRLVNQQLIC